MNADSSAASSAAGRRDPAPRAAWPRRAHARDRRNARRHRRRPPRPAPTRTSGASTAATPATRSTRPLDRITADNVDRLRIAWTWTSVDEKLRAENPIIRDGQRFRTYAYEVTPLVVDGVLYTTTNLGQVAAIDPTTGEDDLELRPRPLPGRAPLGARLPDPGARLVVGWRGSPTALRGRADLAGLGRREDRRAGSGVRPQRARRSDTGSRPHHRHEPVRGQLRPARGGRDGRRGLGDHGGHRPQGGAARARARLRRPHRRDEVDLPHHPAAGASSATRPGATSRGSGRAGPTSGRT